jgi:predicted O-methyltransferase YrrM
MVPARIKSWIERKRPAPLDILTPLMQAGRFRTWVNAVLKRPALHGARAQAWRIYQPLAAKLGVAAQGPPTDKLARFAHHVVHCGLPKPIRYLEVGAYEGNSAAYVYTLLEGNVRVTVVDPFEDSIELAGIKMDKVLERFTANMAAVGATSAVRVLKGRSVDHLPKLIDCGEQFDIIYIDGSHTIADVMLDATLGWQLLARGGLMIFDDYWYRRPELGRAFRPKLAIDAFVGAMAHDIEVLDVATQVFLRKK